MQRRNFLKNILGAGVALTPIAAIARSPAIAEKQPEKARPVKQVYHRRPVSVMIENLTDNIVENVDVFGAAQYLGSKWMNEQGDVEKEGVRITSMIDGVTYGDILRDNMMCPFKVDEFVLRSDNHHQLCERILLISRDMVGNYLQAPVGPYYDPYYKIDCVQAYHPFLMECFTALRIQRVHPRTKLKVYVYASVAPIPMIIKSDELVKNHSGYGI